MLAGSVLSISRSAGLTWNRRLQDRLRVYEQIITVEQIREKPTNRSTISHYFP
jgi:hypothetical protein